MELTAKRNTFRREIFFSLAGEIWLGSDETQRQTELYYAIHESIVSFSAAFKVRNQLN